MAVFIAELVGFVVILYVIFRYIVPLLKPIIRARQDAIQQQVDDSEEATRKLKDAEQRFESAAAEARNEAARIRDDARADAQRIREELREQAEREIERIRQRGVEQLAAQRDQVVRQLRAELGGLSMQLAEQVVVESLADDRRKAATVDRFLDDLDRLPESGADSRQATSAAGGAT